MTPAAPVAIPPVAPIAPVAPSAPMAPSATVAPVAPTVKPTKLVTSEYDYASIGCDCTQEVCLVQCKNDCVQ
jgi:hypothetical protein